MNENMNMNLIMPGGRGWKNGSQQCWLRYVCILWQLSRQHHHQKEEDKETELEKLARKVLLIFAAFSVNDWLLREILSASDIIKMTNEKCTALCSLSPTK